MDAATVRDKRSHERDGTDVLEMGEDRTEVAGVRGDREQGRQDC